MPKPAEDPIAKASNTLAELQKRRDAFPARIEKLKGQKATLAHAALTGNASARTKLDTINAEVRGAELDMDDLDAAIRTAEIDLADEEARARAASETAKFEAMLLRLTGTREKSRIAAEGLANFIANISEVVNDIDAAGRAGAQIPDRHLLRVNLRTAFQAALMPTKLNEDYPPPGQRHPVGELLEHWIASAERSLKAKHSHAGAVTAKKRRVA